MTPDQIRELSARCGLMSASHKGRPRTSATFKQAAKVLNVAADLVEDVSRLEVRGILIRQLSGQLNKALTAIEEISND